MFERDYLITGKHANYIKFLAVKNSQDTYDSDTVNSARIFERYIDVYMNGAIWGVLYSRRATKDTSVDSNARIYADAFAKERETCVFLYRLVMLLDTSEELTSDERIDRAFRYDSQPENKEKFEQCMELFNSYVRGGIEVMYERFTDGCTTKEDYFDKTFEVLENFKKDIEGISYEEEINKMLGK